MKEMKKRKHYLKNNRINSPHPLIILFYFFEKANKIKQSKAKQKGKKKGKS